MNLVDMKNVNNKLKDYNPDYPIIVGLAGKAATGKTSVAETIVPKASFANEGSGIVWDHIFFAMPLYEFYSIRTKIEGINSQSRKLYAIHEALYDLYGSSPIGNIPNYYEFISLVDTIGRELIDVNGAKPRSFLQKVGDQCRAHDEACFAKWGIRKAKRIHGDYLKNLNKESAAQLKPHCILISDVRFKNEAEAIMSQPNSLLIRFEAKDDVRQSRILARDNMFMTAEQVSHRSENEIETFSDLVSDIIDSSNMTVEEQSQKTINLIKESFGI